jgi:two-component system, cell cycle response regulator
MTYDNEIQEILHNLKVVDKIYEQVRFVDPLNKKVIDSFNKNEVRENDVKDTPNSVPHRNLKCFEMWGKGRICDNCISIRAYNENQTLVKLEYSPDQIYMITAVPVELNNKKIVVELMKDMTNSIVFGNGDYDNTSSAMYEMIDNLNNLALKDSLTGAYNRRYIQEKLPIDLINASFSKQSLSIIMADIDFFKKINDTYGHLTGDEILKRFTEVLQACIKRESDWVARFGGEEFLICLPGAGLEKAVEVAETMRQTVEANFLLWGPNQIALTASFGVCSFHVFEEVTVEGVIQCADQMLYKAKNKGRNRVEGNEIQCDNEVKIC